MPTDITFVGIGIVLKYASCLRQAAITQLTGVSIPGVSANILETKIHLYQFSNI